VEAALAGTPLVTFYKVSAPSWVIGKLLVRVPFYSMVNLIYGGPLVPELMQGRLTGEALAAEARRLLADAGARERMRAGLAEVRRRLTCDADPIERAATVIEELLEGQVAHVS
jgi:lipid-A-disaccharide synthase